MRPPRTPLILSCALLSLSSCTTTPPSNAPTTPTPPTLLILGIAQDGGVPQAGSFDEPGWTDPSKRRRVSCLGLIDPATGHRWMFDATPDFPSQLRDLCQGAAARPRTEPILDGIFLTHAHIGHYTGLMHLGREVIGARGVPVHATSRMRDFLEHNGPWSQLVTLGNIALSTLHDGERVVLGPSLTVTPISVPHRQEFSDVVGFRIEGPSRRVLFIPDIDSWEAWDESGVRLEEAIRSVDLALLDGTFFSPDELPGLRARAVPHPPITTTMNRLSTLPASERAKVRFMHLNHTNPALWEKSEARRRVTEAGFSIATEGDRTPL